MPPASASKEEITRDKLLGGHGPFVSRKMTLLLGQNLTRGALLGRRSVGAVGGAAIAGNTGNGTITGVAAGSSEPKPGVYKVLCIEPAANLGTFEVIDPDGILIGKANVGVAFNGPVNFTINDGAADFVAGDGFDVTVAAGDNKCLLSVPTADDGSNVPDLILAEDCDATAADKECLVYSTGTFVDAALTLGAGHTIASVREGLRAKSIHLVSIQGA